MSKRVHKPMKPAFFMQACNQLLFKVNITELAQPRNCSIVTRPFSLSEGGVWAQDYSSHGPTSSMTTSSGRAVESKKSPELFQMTENDGEKNLCSLCGFSAVLQLLVWRCLGTEC